jgi:hypothetical protein
MQIPVHLQCPMGLKEDSVFKQYPPSHRDFFNSARTWAVQAGMVEQTALDSGGSKANNKHVDRVDIFMNRMLGLNLEHHVHVRTPLALVLRESGGSANLLKLAPVCC